MSNFDESKVWHLAKNKEEMAVTEFELLLWRVFHGFLRWAEDCELVSNNNALTGNDLSVLHVMRMQNRPKTTNDIARILNREDMFNISYSIKKLLKLKLIEKTKGAIKRGATYQMTDAGIKNTDNFAKVRQQILIKLYEKESGLELDNLIHNLVKITAIYHDAERIAASYKNVST